MGYLCALIIKKKKNQTSKDQQQHKYIKKIKFVPSYVTKFVTDLWLDGSFLQVFWFPWQ